MQKLHLTLLICLSSPVFAAEGKLIRLEEQAQSHSELPSCESLRDFSKIPPASRRIVQRFWKDFALPYEGRDVKAHRYASAKDFNSALDAMIASLPAADREEAEKATLPLAPPAGVCHF